MSDALTREEIIEQSAQVVQSGRLALLTSEFPDNLSSLLGDIAVSMMEFGADVIRVDALASPSAADMISALCDYLGVAGQDLIAGLRIRGETGNPVCLVIDNGECLDGKALDVLKRFLEATSCGVGILVGGEPDAALYLADAAIAVPFAQDIDQHDVGEGESFAQDAPALTWHQLPWRHFAAAAGLALLVWLFWPAAGTGPADETRELSLPVAAPDAPEVVEPPVRQLYDEPHDEQDIGQPVAPEPEPEPEPVAQTPVPTPEPVATPKPEPVAPVQKPAPVAKASPAPKPVTDTATTKPAPELSGLSAELGYRQEEWLLTQAPGNWVLQVALANDENGARQLLDQIGRKRSAYYRANRNGRQLFIVLAGPWKSRDQAVAGKSALPASLQQLGPFPRELAAIQKEIGANP